MKHITILTPCYNEAENVEELHTQIQQAMTRCPAYTYDHIYIDNSSTDGTVEILRRLAAQDATIRVILNTRNFGHIRSPYHGLLQGEGDAVICMASDLQDPPALIPQFIQRWEEGYKVVLGVKSSSQETPLFYFLRTAYYRILHSLSDVDLIEHFTGFGLYDRSVIQTLRQIRDPYPYFRGLIAELGYQKAIIPFEQPCRVRGLTKNNFYTLYDMAMLGLTNYSKVPLRLATMFGFGSALISFLVGLVYLIYKLIAWQNFSLGLAPVIVGLFFFGSVQLIFLGIVGEYIGAIYTQVLNRPLVVEKERINFPPPPTDGV